MTTQRSPGLFRRLAHGSLVKQILAGLILGILLAWISKPAAEAVGLLGTLFVGALKAVAPILVLMLVMASIANHQHGQKTNIRPILFLYLLGTFSAALAAVVFSFAFPSTLHLSSSAGDISPPSGIVEVIAGSSTIDQAPITGESLPIEKTVGDKVFAGTITPRSTMS